MGQKQIHKNTQPQTTGQAEKADEDKREDKIAAKDQQPMTDDIDAILGEIDEVLEVNAEDFVNSYIQQGGQ